MEDLLRNDQNLNWVQRRMRCNAGAVYRCLVDRFEADVREMNEICENEGSKKKFESTETESAITFGIWTSTSGRSIVLSKADLTVTCEAFGDVIDKFSIKPHWNEETATCELHIDGTPWPRWRISQRALAHLFFPQ